MLNIHLSKRTVIRLKNEAVFDILNISSNYETKIYVDNKDFITLGQNICYFSQDYNSEYQSKWNNTFITLFCYLANVIWQ